LRCIGRSCSNCRRCGWSTCSNCRGRRTNARAEASHSVPCHRSPSPEQLHRGGRCIGSICGRDGCIIIVGNASGRRGCWIVGRGCVGHRAQTTIVAPPNLDRRPPNSTPPSDRLSMGRRYRLGAYGRVVIESRGVGRAAFENQGATPGPTSLTFMVGRRASDGVMKPPRYRSKAHIKGFHLLSANKYLKHVGSTII